MQPRNKLDNKKTCKSQLEFLNYLRKSQCTFVLGGENRLGDTVRFLRPNNDEECKKTLAEMREVATECMQNIGYKR